MNENTKVQQCSFPNVKLEYYNTFISLHGVSFLLSFFFLRKPNFVYDKYKVYQFYRIYTIKTSFKNSDQMFTHLVTLFEDVHLINKSIAFD